ncbi:MAG: shikimate kinase [Chloroflexota bacterium]
MLDTNIILIGPMAAGKTTQKDLLAEALGVPAVELDMLRWDYYAEIGYDKEKARQISREEGFDALLKYWKPFEVHAVQRILQDYPSDHVIGFGAGHSVYDDPAQFEQVRTALTPFPYVILLLPSADVTESTHILTERLRAEEPDMTDEDAKETSAANRTFIENPSNARLAKFTVYTKDKTPAETCAEIMAHIQPSI